MWRIADLMRRAYPVLFQYCMYFPGVTLLLKLPLTLPCVSSQLERIRGGFERNATTRNATKSAQLA